VGPLCYGHQDSTAGHLGMLDAALLATIPRIDETSLFPMRVTD